MIGILIIFFSFSVLPVRAGVVSADTLYLSTVTGQSNSNGITISSSVFFISGSSLTLQGSGGTITSQSSITASAFFGDGSHLSNVLGLNSTNTLTGANTFVSSFTVQGGGEEIILSTSAAAKNIDISSQGIVSFSPPLDNSSSTVISEYSTSITTFGPCVPGSTVTLVTTGGQVEATFTGMVADDSVYDSHPGVSILQDGAFVRDLSTTKSIIEDYMTSSAVGRVQIFGISNFNYLIPSPSPGTHSYCLTIRTTQGPLDSPTVTLYNDSLSTNIFYVKELK